MVYSSVMAGDGPTSFSIEMTQFQKGSTVRPANDGEDSRGNLLKWTNLVGVVVDSWEDCGETRVQVRWSRKAPFPTVLPSDWLSLV